MLFVEYIWKTSHKLEAFIISFRRCSNANSTAENTYHGRFWTNVFKYNIMYEHRRRHSLKLPKFFKIKFVLYNNKIKVVDGCAGC